MSAHIKPQYKVSPRYASPSSEFRLYWEWPRHLFPFSKCIALNPWTRHPTDCSASLLALGYRPHKASYQFTSTRLNFIKWNMIHFYHTLNVRIELEQSLIPCLMFAHWQIWSPTTPPFPLALHLVDKKAWVLLPLALAGSPNHKNTGLCMGTSFKPHPSTLIKSRAICPFLALNRHWMPVLLCPESLSMHVINFFTFSWSTSSVSTFKPNFG